MGKQTHASAAQSLTKCSPITCPWAWKGRRGNLRLLRNSADTSRRQTSSRRWWLEGNKLRAKSMCQRTFIFASYSKFAPTSAASSVFFRQSKTSFHTNMLLFSPSSIQRSKFNLWTFCQSLTRTLLFAQACSVPTTMIKRILFMGEEKSTSALFPWEERGRKEPHFKAF